MLGTGKKKKKSDINLKKNSNKCHLNGYIITADDCFKQKRNSLNTITFKIFLKLYCNVEVFISFLHFCCPAFMVSSNIFLGLFRVTLQFCFQIIATHSQRHGGKTETEKQRGQVEGVSLPLRLARDTSPPPSPSKKTNKKKTMARQKVPGARAASH